MKFNQNKTIYVLRIVCILILILYGFACTFSDNPIDETGGLSFSIKWVDAPPMINSDNLERAAKVDCKAAGISSIEVFVYYYNTVTDEAELYLSKTFDCTAGRGTILGIPAGEDRRFRILGLDKDGEIVYWGAPNMPVDISPGEIAQVGIVDMYSANPEIDYSSHPNGYLVKDLPFKVQWGTSYWHIDINTVTIYVSDNRDFANIIETGTATLDAFTLQNLQWGNKYFCKIKFHDSLSGYESCDSEIFTFYTLPNEITEFSGIISTDTILSLSNSPYLLIDDVQVDESVTLTIEPGVEIYGDGFYIELYGGKLDAVGNEASHIKLFNTGIRSGTNYDQYCTINIGFAEIEYGSILYDYYNLYSIILRNSIITDVPTIYLEPQGEDSYIEQNIFLHCGGLITRGLMNGPNVYIGNNVFYQQRNIDNYYNWYFSNQEFAIMNIENYGNTETVVELNSFLSNDRIALILPPDYQEASIIAINNYWNTTDSSIIDSMIFDKNDDLGSADYIVYTPFLTDPDPMTPDPTPYID